tara:strand:- start:855 stop:1541 length:687 start_codon:yes stop_codon:yes gene_type:complete
MSILSQQDIRKSRTPDAMNRPGSQAPIGWLKWQENLGQERTRPETTGFGGFTYSPPGLQLELGTTDPDNYKGPRGNPLDSNSVDGTGAPLSDSPGQYGPTSFTRLASKEDGATNARSLLGAFGMMINEGSEWGQGNPAAKMKTTFTSGRQMNSLKISSIGVAGTPIASGGTFQGYESGDKEYGITNYNLNQVQIGADDQTTPTAPATEEIRGTIPIENTGLRNIPDMA